MYLLRLSSRIKYDLYNIIAQYTICMCCPATLFHKCVNSLWNMYGLSIISLKKNYNILEQAADVIQSSLVTSGWRVILKRQFKLQVPSLRVCLELHHNIIDKTYVHVLLVFVLAGTIQTNSSCEAIIAVDKSLTGVAAIHEAKYSDVTTCLYQCQQRSDCVTTQWHTTGVCKLYDVSSRRTDVTVTSDGSSQLFEFICDGVYPYFITVLVPGCDLTAYILVTR